jgi:hypothetical protein
MLKQSRKQRRSRRTPKLAALVYPDYHRIADSTGLITRMLDHMILTSLAFHEAALKPLIIEFFLLYKGGGDHPGLLMVSGPSFLMQEGFSTGQTVVVDGGTVLV